MGERKIINRYFPPDWNPALVPRMKKKEFNVRAPRRAALPFPAHPPSTHARPAKCA